MSTIRVQVLHQDPEHPAGEPSHYGPAFDSAYAGMLSEITGVTDVDLVVEAQKCADRFLDEHDDSWTARLVQLTADPDDETRSSWVEL